MTRTIKTTVAAVAVALGFASAPASAQSVDQMLYQLASACYQGNMFACNQHDMLMMEVQIAQQQAYMQQQMMMQPTPGYDPNNVMGATHQQRMNNIQAFGAANTAAHNQRMQASDASHAAALARIRQ